MGVLKVVRPEAGEEGFALFDSGALVMSLHYRIKYTRIHQRNPPPEELPACGGSSEGRGDVESHQR